MYSRSVQMLYDVNEVEVQGTGIRYVDCDLRMRTVRARSDPYPLLQEERITSQDVFGAPL